MKSSTSAAVAPFAHDQNIKLKNNEEIKFMNVVTQDFFPANLRKFFSIQSMSWSGYKLRSLGLIGLKFFRQSKKKFQCLTILQCSYEGILIFYLL